MKENQVGSGGGGGGGSGSGISTGRSASSSLIGSSSLQFWLENKPLREVKRGKSKGTVINQLWKQGDDSPNMYSSNNEDGNDRIEEKFAHAQCQHFFFSTRNRRGRIQFSCRGSADVTVTLSVVRFGKDKSRLTPKDKQMIGWDLSKPIFTLELERPLNAEGTYSAKDCIWSVEFTRIIDRFDREPFEFKCQVYIFKPYETKSAKRNYIPSEACFTAEIKPEFKNQIKIIENEEWIRLRNEEKNYISNSTRTLIDDFSTNIQLPKNEVISVPLNSTRSSSTSSPEFKDNLHHFVRAPPNNNLTQSSFSSFLSTSSSSPNLYNPSGGGGGGGGASNPSSPVFGTASPTLPHINSNSTGLSPLLQSLATTSPQNFSSSSSRELNNHSPDVNNPSNNNENNNPFPIFRSPNYFHHSNLYSQNPNSINNSNVNSNTIPPHNNNNNMINSHHTPTPINTSSSPISPSFLPSSSNTTNNNRSFSPSFASNLKQLSMSSINTIPTVPNSYFLPKISNPSSPNPLSPSNNLSNNMSINNNLSISNNNNINSPELGGGGGGTTYHEEVITKNEEEIRRLRLQLTQAIQVLNSQFSNSNSSNHAGNTNNSGNNNNSFLSHFIKPIDVEEPFDFIKFNVIKLKEESGNKEKRKSGKEGRREKKEVMKVKEGELLEIEIINRNEGPVELWIFLSSDIESKKEVMQRTVLKPCSIKLKFDPHQYLRATGNAGGIGGGGGPIEDKPNADGAACKDQTMFFVTVAGKDVILKYFRFELGGGNKNNNNNNNNSNKKMKRGEGSDEEYVDRDMSRKKQKI